jgi:6-phosphogluconolactonase
MLDVVLLGTGADGHVCSLFPSHRALDARDWVTSVDDAPKPPPRRITLTRPTLALARAVILAAFEESKADVIDEALHDRRSSLPLALVLREAPRPLLLLTPSTSSKLQVTKSSS